LRFIKAVEQSGIKWIEFGSEKKGALLCAPLVFQVMPVFTLALSVA
jgi:hypothetical protein